MKLGRILLGSAVLLVVMFVATSGHANHGQFYVLDGFGGVHAGGGAPAISPLTPYFGFDIAKGIAFVAQGTGISAGDGILVLDGFGGVHDGGALAADAVAPKTPYFGFDIARAIVARNVPPRLVGAIADSSNITVSSTSYVSMVSAQFFAPDDGNIAAICSASIGCNGCDAANPTHARVAVGLDSLGETSAINRQVGFVGVTFTASAMVQMIPVTAGSHTVNCLIRKDFGTPDPQYFDATVAVVYIDLNGSGLTLPESAAPGGPTGVVIGQ